MFRVGRSFACCLCLREGLPQLAESANITQTLTITSVYVYRHGLYSRSLFVAPLLKLWTQRDLHWPECLPQRRMLAWGQASEGQLGVGGIEETVVAIPTPCKLQQSCRYVSVSLLHYLCVYIVSCSQAFTQSSWSIARISCMDPFHMMSQSLCFWILLCVDRLMVGKRMTGCVAIWEL